MRCRDKVTAEGEAGHEKYTWQVAADDGRFNLTFWEDILIAMAGYRTH